MELPSADEEDDVEAEQTPAEAVPSGRRKRKGLAPPLDSTARPGIPGKFRAFQLFSLDLFCFLFSNLFLLFCPAGSPSPPPTKLKKLKKRGEVEYFAAEEAAAIPAATSGTDDELREAFEEVEQEKELQELEEVPQEKVAAVEDEVSFSL